MVADNRGDISLQKEQYYFLTELYTRQKKYNAALVSYKKYIALRDSIFSEQNTKNIVRTEMNYDFEKKEAETKADQEKKDLIAQEELQRQKLVRNSFIGGFAIVLLFAGVFFTQRNKILDAFLTNNMEHFRSHGSVIAYVNDRNRSTLTKFGFETVYRDQARKLSVYRLPGTLSRPEASFDRIKMIVKTGL